MCLFRPGTRCFLIEQKDLQDEVRLNGNVVELEEEVLFRGLKSQTRNCFTTVCQPLADRVKSYILRVVWTHGENVRGECLQRGYMGVILLRLV